MTSKDSVNDDKVKEGGVSNGIQEVEPFPSWKEQLEENERKVRVNAAWDKMNSGLPAKVPKPVMNLTSSTANKPAQQRTPHWMVSLGLAPKKSSGSPDTLGKQSASVASSTSEEVKRFAAAALSAVRDVTNAAAAAAAGRGKIEITEVRDFAGEEIEMKKFVNSDSKEAAEKSKPSTPPSALDNILEQIKKKPKLSVLDKSKKDWGEFKNDNKGLEDELDAYKKSSNQYLDKVSFLQRTDLREFEQERDARLASQAKRKTDMREDDL